MSLLQIAACSVAYIFVGLAVVAGLSVLLRLLVGDPSLYEDSAGDAEQLEVEGAA